MHFECIHLIMYNMCYQMLYHIFMLCMIYDIIYINLHQYNNIYIESPTKMDSLGYPHFRKPPCINYMYTCNNITVNSHWPGNTLLARETMPPPQANERSLLRSG